MKTCPKTGERYSFGHLDNHYYFIRRSEVWIIWRNPYGQWDKVKSSYETTAMRWANIRKRPQYKGPISLQTEENLREDLS